MNSQKTLPAVEPISIEQLTALIATPDEASPIRALAQAGNTEQINAYWSVLINDYKSLLRSQFADQIKSIQQEFEESMSTFLTKPLPTLKFNFNPQTFAQRYDLITKHIYRNGLWGFAFAGNAKQVNQLLTKCDTLMHNVTHMAEHAIAGYIAGKQPQQHIDSAWNQWLKSANSRDETKPIYPRILHMMIEYVVSNIPENTKIADRAKILGDLANQLDASRTSVLENTYEIVLPIYNQLGLHVELEIICKRILTEKGIKEAHHAVIKELAQLNKYDEVSRWLTKAYYLENTRPHQEYSSAHHLYYDLYEVVLAVYKSKTDPETKLETALIKFANQHITECVDVWHKHHILEAACAIENSEERQAVLKTFLYQLSLMGSMFWKKTEDETLTPSLKRGELNAAFLKLVEYMGTEKVKRLPGCHKFSLGFFNTYPSKKELATLMPHSPAVEDATASSMADHQKGL